MDRFSQSTRWALTEAFGHLKGQEKLLCSQVGWKKERKKSQKKQDVKLQVRRRKCPHSGIISWSWKTQIKGDFLQKVCECRTKLELRAWSVIRNSAPQPESSGTLIVEGAKVLGKWFGAQIQGGDSCWLWKDNEGDRSKESNNWEGFCSEKSGYHRRKVLEVWQYAKDFGPATTLMPFHSLLWPKITYTHQAGPPVPWRQGSSHLCSLWGLVATVHPKAFLGILPETGMPACSGWVLKHGWESRFRRNHCWLLDKNRKNRIRVSHSRLKYPRVNMICLGNRCQYWG